MPPLVADFQQTAVFFAKQPSDIPCGLMGKLATSLTLKTEAQQLVQVPKHARFLRGCYTADSAMGVVVESEQHAQADFWPYKAVLGCLGTVSNSFAEPLMLAILQKLGLQFQKTFNWPWTNTCVGMSRLWCSTAWIGAADG